MTSMSPPGPLDALRVVAHPLRLRLLSLLTGESLSASEAARALGETQANVCYHLRRLAQAGLVDLVEETRVRGGAAKRYRHNPLSGSTLVAGADDATTALLGTLSGELARRSTLATGAQLAFTDAEVWVSPDAWARIQSLARELGTLVHDEARARDAGLIHLGATLAVFPMRATTAMS